MKQLIIEIDEGTKKKFREITITNDTSMAEVIRTHINKYIAEKTQSVIY